MRTSLEISGMTKVFQTPSGPYTAIKDVQATMREGEFVCILGHSGCGKSTVLSIIAGLQKATFGGVVINGKEVDTLAGHVDLRHPLAKSLDWVQHDSH